MAGHVSLIKALELRAYNEWMKSFSSMNTLRYRITNNPKGNLTQLLLHARDNWSSYNELKRLSVLEIIVHECAYAFEIPSPKIFGPEAWEAYLRKKGIDEAIGADAYFDEAHHWSMKSAGGFFMPWEDVCEAGAIIIIEQDPHFIRSVGLIAHEMAHAVHAYKTKKLFEKIKADLEVNGPWQELDKDSYIHDPLFTALCLEAFADKGQQYKIAKEMIDSKDSVSYYDEMVERFALVFDVALRAQISTSLLLAEAGKDILSRVNMLIKQSQLLVTTVYEFTKTHSLVVTVPHADQISSLEPCKLPQEILEDEYYNLLRDFVFGMMEEWSAVEAGFGDDISESVRAESTDIHDSISTLCNLRSDVYELLFKEAENK